MKKTNVIFLFFFHPQNLEFLKLYYHFHENKSFILSMQFYVII
jgi:hypothetical protein